MDFNKKQIEKYKEKVKDLTRKEPALAEEILKIVEERENATAERIWYITI